MSTKYIIQVTDYELDNDPNAYAVTASSLEEALHVGLGVLHQMPNVTIDLFREAISPDTQDGFMWRAADNIYYTGSQFEGEWNVQDLQPIKDVVHERGWLAN